MFKRVSFIAFVAMMLITTVAMAAESEKEAAALSAAYKWLNQVDQGNYAESWQGAAEYFRNAITKNDWVDSLAAVRTPLGKLISRTLKSSTYATSLPGAPDGEYVVIQFTTSFENKKIAVETVTPMRGKDGTWRVSGYYIK